MRKNISSGAKWEDIVGYSRAVRIGNIVEVAGTTAADKGTVVHVDDPYQQTIYILEIIKAALEEAGSSLQDVVRTRMFVTNIADWQAIGKAHGEYFGSIKPVTTLVEVSNLVDDRMLVEIEATAIIA